MFGIPILALRSNAECPVTLAASAEECTTSSKKEFLAIPAARWASEGLPRVVIDCCGALRRLQSAKGIRYLGLGNRVAREETVAGRVAQ